MTRTRPTADKLFDVPSIMAEAIKQAGGGSDSLLDTPGLHALCSALDAAGPQMNFIGRRRARKMLVETLIKRLRLAHYLKTVPTIREIPIRQPVLLVAPFRSGTTFLHRLLARDPAHRTPRLWEALQAPPQNPDYQGDPEYFASDYRVDIARTYLATREKLTPDIAAIHPTSVDAPEECFGLLESSLVSHSFTFYGPVLEYLDWLDTVGEDDWRVAYAMYADQLRLLQWWAPGERWVLKTPFHLWSVGALAATFPDGLIVQQHRDPAACVASYCSLTMAAYRPIGHADKHQIGQIALRFLRDGLARNVAAREQLEPARFIDIHYDELVGDPLACARRVYAAQDRELSADVETAMRQWLAEQAATRKGAKHSYSLDDYGLDQDEVNAAFARYDRFGASR